MFTHRTISASPLSLYAYRCLMPGAAPAGTILEGDPLLLDVSRTAGVGLNLRRLRAAKGLTLDRLASLSELTRGYISLVERGLKAPSIAALLRMAKALDVNVAYLFDAKAAGQPRYTIHRHQDEGAIPDKNGSFGLLALAAARPHKSMERFLLTPPCKSARHSTSANEKVQRAVHSGD